MNVQGKNEVQQAGYQDGVAWREGRATKGQLTRLRRFQAERPDFEAWFDEAEQYGRGETATSSLARIIDPKLPESSGYGPDPVELFWNEVGGDEADVDDVDYLQGFVEGALS